MAFTQIFTLLLLPILLAGLHGWFTNWLAIKLLLKPVHPVNILGFKIQGLLPRRQADLADRISEAISREFLKEEDIMVFLKKIEPAKAMRQLILDKWEEKVGEFLGTMPFISMFVSSDKLIRIRDKVAEIFSTEAEKYTELLVQSLETKIDLRDTIKRNILAFDVQRLNKIIEEIGYKEFNEIAFIGLVLGVFIGVVQALVNFFIFRGGT
ncbi:MAG: putative YheB protein [Fibrobacteres bacterium]|nr:putative YheB protein [Fibrobacterota bacterium]